MNPDDESVAVLERFEHLGSTISESTHDLEITMLISKALKVFRSLYRNVAVKEEDYFKN